MLSGSATKSGLEPSTMVVGVIGLGYVGRPRAVECAENGVETIGIDVDVSKVQNLLLGRSHIENIESSALTSNPIAV